MSDMFVNLMLLDQYMRDMPDLSVDGINIRRAMPYERAHLLKYVTKQFGLGWADQAEMAFSQHPVTCFIATYEGRIVGFAAFEGTNRNFFGPTGVDAEFRKRGIGRILLVKCMQAMRDMGYAYAIIGSAGPQDFYNKNVGAVSIPDSVPGVYTDILKSID